MAMHNEPLGAFLCRLGAWAWVPFDWRLRGMRGFNVSMALVFTIVFVLIVAGVHWPKGWEG
jgi:hypothetical protein